MPKPRRRIDRGPLRDALALEQAIASLRDLSEETPPDEQQAVIKAVQEVLSRHLIAYATGELDEVNPDAAYVLGDGLRDLTRGYVGSVLEPQRTRGSPRRENAADNALAHAVHYLKLVHGKEIKDPAPTKRVAEYFGVTDHATIRRWRRKVSTIPAEAFWRGTVWDERAVKAFHELLVRFGAHYRSYRGTRTTKAIRTRAKRVQGGGRKTRI